MVRVFDEADYRRRLDQAAEISTGEEIKLIIKGWVTGEGSGPLDAQKAMNEAKQIALRKARKEMLQAIDKHPGLYRDSHTVFLNGSVVSDGKVAAFRAGDQINISNPVPYARKIEIGHGRMSLPGHVYEDAALIVAQRFGNSDAVKFTFMPVRFGSVQAIATFSRPIRPGRRLSQKAREDWLVRQPALEIRVR